MRKLFQYDKLKIEDIKQIMMTEKPNQIEKIKLDTTKIRKVLPINILETKVEYYEVKSLVHYEEYLQHK